MDIPDMQSYIADAKEEALRQKAKRPGSKTFAAWVDGQLSGYAAAEKILGSTVPLSLESKLRDTIKSLSRLSLPSASDDAQCIWGYWHGVGVEKASRELFYLVDT